MKIKVVAAARVNPLDQIASTMNSSKTFDVSNCLDACTCTGNCED